MDNREKIIDEFNVLMGENTSTIEELPPKKSKFRIWKFFLFLFILSSISLVAFYIFVMLKPKTILVNGMSKAIKSVIPIVEPLKFDYAIGDKFIFENTTTLTLGDLGEELTILHEALDKMQLKSTTKFDRTNKKVLVNSNFYIPDVDVSYDYYINDKENYMYFNEIYDKYIKLEDIETDFFSSKITIQDIMYIYTKAYDSFNNSIKEEWITREFNFNNEPMVISKLDITKENYIQIMKNMKTDLLNDSKVKEILLLLNYSEEDIDYMKTENIEANFEKLDITVKQSIIKDNYTSVEISKDSLNKVYDKDKKELVEKIVNDKIVYENNDSKISVKNYADNELDTGFELTYNDKNFELKVIYLEEENLPILKGQANDNNYIYTLIVPIENYNYQTNEDEVTNFEISFSIKYEEAEKLKYEATLGIKYEEFNVMINSNGSVSPLSEDINIDTSNNVTIDNVDAEEFEQNLLEHFKNLKLLDAYIDYNTSVVTSSINKSKKNAIYTEAKSLANKYLELSIADELLSESQRQLKNVDSKVTSDWKCLSDSSFSTDLINVLEISSEDYILKGNVIKGEPTSSNITNKTCSAIRKNNSMVEILLVANPNGKFGESNNEVLYGWSGGIQ